MRLACVIGVLVYLAVSPARALEVPLTVAEPVGVARKAEPVSSGVCFKPGEVKAAATTMVGRTKGMVVKACSSDLPGNW